LGFFVELARQLLTFGVAGNNTANNDIGKTGGKK